MRSSLRGVVFALAVLGSPTFAQASAPAISAAPVASSFRERAEGSLVGLMERHHIPGLSLAIGHRGEQVFAVALGFANLEARVPLTLDSVFPLGSTSKALTSLALGKLIEAGKLDLDAPIQTYVPYFPDKGQKITARLLGGHQAGLRDYDLAKGEYANGRHFESVREAVGVFADDPLLHTPGSKYVYSVYGFVLLSAAIEGASGQDFLSFEREQIFAPLGLECTGPDLRPAPMPGVVTSYSVGFRGRVMPSPATDVSNKWAAGGFASTSREMVRLGNALLAGELVRPATFELLTKPQKLADGSDSGAGYAIGWRRSREILPHSRRELTAIHHGGVANGAQSFFLLVPEEALVVSINVNLTFQPFSELSGTAFEIAELFLESLKEEQR